MSVTSDSSELEPTIAIIGAGLGGITTAIALKSQLKFGRFVVYERASEVGGTWRDNSYPGCGCDIPSHWYSLSTELNPNWSSKHSGQLEILQYWKDLSARHDIDRHIRFNKDVLECQWNPQLSTYTIHLRDRVTGMSETATANLVISCTGGFHEPEFPSDLEGRDVFKGRIWHSARWNHDVDLKSKRVGVIGNGCSAAQLVPVITEEKSTTVVQFCRTPNWFVPRGNPRFSSFTKWVFKHVPFVMRTYRNFIFASFDINWSLVFPLKSKFSRKLAVKYLTSYMKSKIPEKYQKQMIPTYPPGCKRMIFDPCYLDCLDRSNLTLNFGGVDRLVESGLITAKGEKIDLDVIVFATGFDIIRAAFEVKGVDPELGLNDYWESVGGPNAYYGVMVPGFPNFFMTYGPNTVTGHASVIFSLEAQANYIVKLVEPIIKGNVMSIDVKRSVTNSFNDWVQSRLRESVFTKCSSWYRKEHEGRIIANWPGMVTLYWWKLLVPKWKDFDISSAKGQKWKPRSYISSWIRAIF